MVVYGEIIQAIVEKMLQVTFTVIGYGQQRGVDAFQFFVKGSNAFCKQHRCGHTSQNSIKNLRPIDFISGEGVKNVVR